MHEAFIPSRCGTNISRKLSWNVLGSPPTEKMEGGYSAARRVTSMSRASQFQSASGAGVCGASVSGTSVSGVSMSGASVSEERVSVFACEWGECGWGACECVACEWGECGWGA